MIRSFTPSRLSPGLTLESGPDHQGMGYSFLLVAWSDDAAFSADFPGIQSTLGTKRGLTDADLLGYRVVRLPSGVVVGYFFFRPTRGPFDLPDITFVAKYGLLRSAYRRTDSLLGHFSWFQNMALLRSTADQVVVSEGYAPSYEPQGVLALV